MANHHFRTLIQQLRQSLCPRGDDTLSDAELLERWVQQRDETAFDVLLWRHGPMVLAVCRRLLPDSHDVEDAFQAAFLTLVRKSASIRRPQALAGWLYRVAYRIALRLRGETAQRSRRQQPYLEMLTSADREAPGTDDWRAVLDEEIDALPERYRQVLVLCYLEGKTHAEAGRLVGRPTGTISCWLKRGRELLSGRLAQRGIAPAALAALGESEVRAVLPAALAQSTCRAASAFAAGEAGATAVISARVAALVEGAMRGMTATKLQWTLVLGLMLSMAATGAGMWAYQPSPTPELPAERKAETDASKQSPQQDKQAARTDRYGDSLPQGAVARLGTVRQRAVDAETAISPDGKTIVALHPELGQLVKFFDADTGKLRERWALHGAVSAEDRRAFLSSDGRLLAVQEAASEPLDVWDVTTRKRLRRLHLGQGREIAEAVFSPDGKTLAAVERDKKGEKVAFRLWDITSGGQRELKGYEDSPNCLAFSPDGKLLAAEDRSDIICWHVAKGEQLWRVDGMSSRSFAFTPDGRTLIVAPGEDFRSFLPERKAPPAEGDPEYEIWQTFRARCLWRAWDTATGKPARGLKLPEEAVAFVTFRAGFAVAPDNRTLVFVPSAGRSDHRRGDDRVRLWDLRTGKPLQTLAVAGKDGQFSLDVRIQIGSFFPDGKSFLTNNGALQRWELASGRPLLPDTEKLGHRAEIISVVYSPDGRRLATAAHDCTIRLWDVATAKPLHLLRVRKGEASNLAFTPDGKHLVSGPDNDELYIWDVETGKEIKRIKLSDPISKIDRTLKDRCFSTLHLSSDGRTGIVVGHGPSITDKEKIVGILSRWDLATGQRKSRVEFKGGMDDYDAFSPDSRLLPVSDKTLNTELLDTTTAKSRVKLEGRGGNFYAFSADGRLVAGLVVAREQDEWDLEIGVWETKSGRPLRRIPLPLRGGGPLALSPDGRYLASAGMKGIRIWDLSTGKVVREHKAHEPTFCVNTASFASCLTFAPDGRTLATGHPDSTVLIWNAAPSKPARRSD